MSRPIFDSDERKLLRRLGESESSLDSLEEGVRQRRRSFRIFGTLSSLSASTGIVIGSIGLLSTPANVILLVLGGAFYLAPFVALSFLGYADYHTFRNLRSTMTKIDKATVGECKSMSQKRRNIASNLMECATIMRTFGPRFPLTLPQRIPAREARLGSQVFKELVYPVMIGAEEELSRVKEILAHALLEVSKGDWIRVKALSATSNDYPSAEDLGARISKVGAFAVKLFPLVGLIPPLIGGLIKYHKNIF